ncbi:MAG: uncharacterized protein KVP18_002627 [Porospora cf. gigantea A]|uniref:uncharacterized protein n=1 Tax=Porospora cf. gigantea A TaxID=2853593 RepID=UPI003559A8A6|nr:MAG: hypothetical protein KVP18_002627 [Porospora cf. gigantea A]
MATDLRKHVDFIGVTVVNDPYVVKGWAKRYQLADDLTLIADVNGVLTRRLGMDSDESSLSLGKRRRSRFFTVLTEKGAVVSFLDYKHDLQAPERVLRFLQSRDMRLEVKKQPSLEDFSDYYSLDIQADRSHEPLFRLLYQADLGRLTEIPMEFELSPAVESVITVANMGDYLRITGGATRNIKLSFDELVFEVSSIRYLVPSFHTFKEGRRVAEMQAVMVHEKSGRRVILSANFSNGGRDCNMANLLSINAFPPPKGFGMETHTKVDVDFSSMFYNNQKFFHHKGFDCFDRLTPVDWLIASAPNFISQQQLETIDEALTATEDPANEKAVKVPEMFAAHAVVKC